MTNPTTAPAPAAQPDTFVQYWGTSDTHSAECQECGWHGEGRHSRAAAQQDADAHRCDVAPAPAAAGQTQQEPPYVAMSAAGAGGRPPSVHQHTTHAAPAPTPEPQGEVVAWMCTSPEGVVELTRTRRVAEELRRIGYTVTPLASPAAAPAQREQALREALEGLRKSFRLSSQEAGDRRCRNVWADALRQLDAALAASPSREEGR